MFKVFIDGQEGTTGLKLYEKICRRGDIQLLQANNELRKDLTERAMLINESDVTFLCLPDVASQQAVSMVVNEKTRLIDASTAHRTVPGWIYGLPELYTNEAEVFKKATRVAVPGCHASGFAVIVKPLIECGLLPADFNLHCTSLTGYSGGGKPMIASYEASDRDFTLSAPRQYGLMQNHKHLKEMQFVSGLDRLPTFQPIVYDNFSGMAVTVPLPLHQLNCTKADVYKALKLKYNNQPVITVCLDEGLSVQGGFLNAGAFAGCDNMEIVVTGNDERLAITAVYDNLGKGASGAGIECMNLMLGFEKTAGLVIKRG